MLYWLMIAAASTSAVSGALQAKRKNMDLFGFIFLAFTTTVGGGTIRDVILKKYPFWIEQTAYIWVCIFWSVAIFFYYRNHSEIKTRNSFLIADALTLALYTYAGAEITMSVLGTNIPVIIIMSIITGIAGGVLRDILSNEIPICLQKELYATPAMAGGIVFVASEYFSHSDMTSMILTVSVVFIFRVISIRYHLHLPEI